MASKNENKVPINDRTVKGLQTTGSRYILTDESLRGFHIRVSATGVKSFYVKYFKAGRQTLLQIGTYPKTSCEAARSQAKILLGKVEGGEDPARSKREGKKRKPSVAELAERFLEQHGPRLKPRTLQVYKGLVYSKIIPSLGRILVNDMDTAHVSGWHHEMRATPRQANHALAILSKMMNLAERWGLRPLGSNPCKHQDRNPEEKRKRYLHAEELASLGEALRNAEQPGGGFDPFAIAAIRLCLFTGARCGEILSAEWAWVNFERKTLDLPDSKTGSKSIMLDGPAWDVVIALSKQRPLGNPYLIPGKKPGTHLTSLEPTWNGRAKLVKQTRQNKTGEKTYAVAPRKGIRDLANLPGVRVHDLRHTNASIGVGLGLSLPVIGGLLGHTVPSTTARYAHLADDPLRSAGKKIQDALSILMNQCNENIG